jgi:hypothetical protein
MGNAQLIANRAHFGTEVYTMRTATIAIASLLLVCHSSFAEYVATRDDVPAKEKQMKHRPVLSTVVSMVGMEMLFVRSGDHTLVFPFADTELGKVDSTNRVPFLLAVKHEDNLVVEQSQGYNSPSPLVIRTTNGAIAVKMLLGVNDDDSNDRREEVHSREIRFIADGVPDADPLVFDLNNGRVFEITTDNGTEKASIRQLPVEMFDTRILPVDYNEVSNRKYISEIISWWKKMERGDVTATARILTRGPDESAGSRAEQHPCDSQEKHRESRSVGRDKGLQACQSDATHFTESRGLYQADSVDFRGPFIVSVGEHVLVFLIAQSDVARMEETIPFLVAVQRQGNGVAISTVECLVTSPQSVTTRGKVQIDNTPPFSLDYTNEIEYWYRAKEGVATDLHVGYSEEMAFFLDEMVAQNDFDLKKGRVFLVAFDAGKGKTRVRQLQIDIFDPKTITADNGKECIDKKIAGVVSWWKKAFQEREGAGGQSVVESEGGRDAENGEVPKKQ